MEYYSALKQPSVSKTIRLPHEMWEKIQLLVEQGNFSDFSHAIRELSLGGYTGKLEAENDITRLW